MKTGLRVQLFLAAAVAIILALLLQLDPAWAQGRQATLRLTVSKGQMVQLPRPARSVFIADPSIADVQVPAKDLVIVFGRKPGETSLFIIGDDEKPIGSYQVVVGYDFGDVDRLVKQDVPTASVNFQTTPTGAVVTGTVPNADTAAQVDAAIKRYLPKDDQVVNQVRVAGAQQVNLRVRVAEVQRTVTKALGINWQAVSAPGSFVFGIQSGSPQYLAGGVAAGMPPLGTLSPLGGNTYFTQPSTGLPVGTSPVVPNVSFGAFSTKRATVNSVIDALADEGLLTILAEPNLTATSGQTASFLAGGEFPIPVASGTAGVGASSAVTIQFKQFGVSLNFVPTILSNDHISLRVEPEVSQLDPSIGVGLVGAAAIIPGLIVRRAETTVDLGSGQSFAIAGLIENTSSTDINKYPGLGDLPVLGPLFRSSSFQSNQTELVIIVTPYIVRPVSEGVSLKTPTDGFAPASDVERIFYDRLTKPNIPGAATELGAGGMRLHGDAGFIVD
ncbi:MAG TPA: type II and III secretion system protein family protein [Stellaceae bacterium]|nr:type II and III secretion system protein family protein [Stellaceae bacterium]